MRTVIAHDRRLTDFRVLLARSDGAGRAFITSGQNTSNLYGSPCPPSCETYREDDPIPNNSACGSAVPSPTCTDPQFFFLSSSARRSVGVDHVGQMDGAGSDNGDAMLLILYASGRRTCRIACLPTPAIVEAGTGPASASVLTT